MALTEIFVDPAIAADSGNGDIGTPYGDLEYAIRQETFNLSGGTRVNIKAGTDEVLVAPISTSLADTSVSIAWAPNEQNQLIFRGYTAAAGDGGIGGISGDGSVAVQAGAYSNTSFIDLHCHNSGTATIITLSLFSQIIRCEIDNTTGGGGNVTTGGVITESYIHNCGNVGASGGNGTYITNNYFENGTNKFVHAITIASGYGQAQRNLIKIDGASNGIRVQQSGRAENNSIWSDGGTGSAILQVNSSWSFKIANNLIEGFSGVGGTGIKLDGSLQGRFYTGGNAVYDCTTEYTDPAIGWTGFDAGDDEILTASPFKDATNDDFTPQNVGNVLFGALPAAFHSGAPGGNVIRLHKGAVQLPAGGMRMVGRGAG